MTDAAGYAEAANLLRRHTGVVIPVFFPDKVGAGEAQALLGATVRAFREQVNDAASICLSVDGPGPGVAAAQSLAAEPGVQVTVAERNRGKFSALRHGAELLLRDETLRYIATVDQDGDHFANELPNFVRAARHAQAGEGVERVMVLGRRLSRHRPMGFLRGELEELADRVLLDALAYDAAVNGKPLRLQYANVLDEFPDFHSGYKLLTRASAEDVFRRAAAVADEFSRHAVEAIITVEALKADGLLVAVNRSTLDEQPVSAFGALNRRQLVADKIIWPCRRMGIPPAFVDQWLRNHMPRLLLGTLLPDGREELLGIYALVMAALEDSDKTTPKLDPLRRGRFI